MLFLIIQKDVGSKWTLKKNVFVFFTKTENVIFYKLLKFIKNYYKVFKKLLKIERGDTFLVR